MLLIIYPISFAVSLFSLIAWFYVQGQPRVSRLASTTFLGGFLVYLFALAFSEAVFSTKLFVLFRDFMVLAAVAQFFNIIKNNKFIFFIMLIIAYAGFHLFYRSVMVNSLSEEVSSDLLLEKMPLDANGELLIQLKNNNFSNNINNLLSKYNVSYKKAFKINQTSVLDNFWVLNLPDDQLDQASQLLKKLLATGEVVYWEENEQIQISPLAAAYASTTKRDFGLNDPGVEHLWGFDALHMDELYTLMEKRAFVPKKKALIAILDTGIDALHEDIEKNYKSIKKEYDTDEMSHGTHCAGIAAAVSNNGKGIAAYSKDNSLVEVASVRVLNRQGAGTQQGIIAGIIEAADAGAAVISMSLGGPSNSARTRAYKEAVAYANDKGAIVVVAAGNSNRPAKNYSPANTPNVITVAAIDEKLDKAVFSNTIEEIKMPVCAPGVGIYSTIPKNGYATYSGTSMATPYVAGFVAIMKAIRPELSTEEVFNILQKTGSDTKITTQTGRLIQPALALEAL